MGSMIVLLPSDLAQDYVLARYTTWSPKSTSSTPTTKPLPNNGLRKTGKVPRTSPGKKMKGSPMISPSSNSNDPVMNMNSYIRDKLIFNEKADYKTENRYNQGGDNCRSKAMDIKSLNNGSGKP